jgi:hypothetical protein
MAAMSIGRADTTRSIHAALAVGWGVVGFAIALPALPNVNPDVRLLVGALSIAGPGAALGAALAIHHDRSVLAAILLVISVFTPTYFAWVLPLIPLVLAVSVLRARRRRVKPSLERGSARDEWAGARWDRPRGR